MSDNFLEKEENKFYKGLIFKVSENLKNKWKRHNFSKGEFRKIKKEKLEQILNKELNEELLKIKKMQSIRD